MDEKLLEELIADTTLEDISDTYKPVVERIGVEHFVALGKYAQGDDLYFPKIDTILIPARNRRILKEYDGYNAKELAEMYNLTVKQIFSILRNVPVPGQQTIFDCFDLPQDT